MDGMSGMDAMGSMNGTSMGNPGSGMLMFFTFATGSSLWFSGATPSTAAATLGASIGLFFLAALHRLIAVARCRFELYWRQRVVVELPQLPWQTEDSPDLAEKLSSSPPSLSPPLRSTVSRSPFNVQRNATRALLEAFFCASRFFASVSSAQAATDFVGYLLMLAVMTMNAGYLLGVILGVGFGEFTFSHLAVIA